MMLTYIVCYLIVFYILFLHSTYQSTRACHACSCAHPCCCFCFCVTFCCCWWICRRCCESPLDIWAGGAGSKRCRTGDSDDSDDGEDAAVSAQLGARLSMNENIRRAKKTLGAEQETGEIRGEAARSCCRETERDVKPAQVERAAGGGCCDAAARRVDCVQAGAAGAHSRGLRGGRA